MADLKISALTDGAPAQDTDIIPVARGAGNRRLTLENVKNYTAAPIPIAFADVATATDLVDGQLYSVTGLAAFTSGIQLNDLRFYAYKDTANIGAVTAVMSAYGYANYSQLGVVKSCQIQVDWYNTGKVVFVNDEYSGNEIAGFDNIDIFPFGTSDKNGNKVAASFTLDITALGSEKFNNNICYGNGSFTATTGRDYEGIDFTKGYFSFQALLSQDSTNAPTAAVQKNEYGETIAYVYSAPGEYRITSALGAFGATINKSWVHIANLDPSLTADVYIKWINANRIDIYVSQFGSGIDSALSDTPVEIRTFL